MVTPGYMHSLAFVCRLPDLQGCYQCPPWFSHSLNLPVNFWQVCLSVACPYQDCSLKITTMLAFLIHLPPKWLIFIQFFCTPLQSNSASSNSKSAGFHACPPGGITVLMELGAEDGSSPHLKCRRFPLFLIRLSTLYWINTSQFVVCLWFFRVLKWLSFSFPFSNFIIAFGESVWQASSFHLSKCSISLHTISHLISTIQWSHVIIYYYF